MSFIKVSVVIIAVLAINGCSYIYGDDGLVKSQEFTYVKAEQTKPLEIPESLIHKDKANYTVVPNIGKKANDDVYGKPLSQMAPTQLLAVMDNTRVDKTSTVPAVLIVDDVDFIWQTATMFLENRYIESSVMDTENRTVVTNWIAIEEGGLWMGLDGSEEPDALRAKYKIVVSKGEINGEYKLAVERIKSQVWDDDNGWTDTAISWRQSADMMNLVLSFYDQRIRVQDARHHDQIMAGFKVELGQDAEGNASLITSASESLVWEKIPRVMNELGMKIIDKDLRQKTYFMEYEEIEAGFFASLFDDEVPTLPLEPGAFQMTVSEIGEQRTLTIKNGEGVAIDASLLVKLYPDLSRLFGDRR